MSVSVSVSVSVAGIHAAQFTPSTLPLPSLPHLPGELNGQRDVGVSAPAYAHLHLQAMLSMFAHPNVCMKQRMAEQTIGNSAGAGAHSACRYSAPMQVLGSCHKAEKVSTPDDMMFVH